MNPGEKMSEPVSIDVRRLQWAEDLPLPCYATEKSSGMDLVAATAGSITIPPMDRVMIPTGLTVALPSGYEMQIRPRSGLALRHGVTVLNTPGTIDEDFRGQICVILMNAGTEPFVVTRGARIAQAVIAPVTRAEWREVDVLPETERSSGGFGSTGV
jgi:dUTP pyrophosphatase